MPDEMDKDSAPEVFINEIRKALGWTSDPVLDSGNPQLPETLDVFSRVARKYRLAHKTIPVLVVDNTNKLPEPLLAQFQGYAKEATDDKIATIVFVWSEGRVPCRMQESSSWSRNESVLEIGDVSKDEAFQYLKLQGVDGEQAARVYEFVSGRMILLNHVANQIQKGIKFDDVRQTLLNKAGVQIRIAGMLPEGKFHKQGKSIIAKLLKESAIADHTYWTAVENEEIGEEMLQRNVFSHHYKADEITFQSTLMQRYCELHSAFWEG